MVLGLSVMFLPPQILTLGKFSQPEQYSMDSQQFSVVMMDWTSDGENKTSCLALNLRMREVRFLVKSQLLQPVFH